MSDFGDRFKNFRGEFGRHFGKLTDEDFEKAGGDREKFVAILQTRYGYEKARAEQEVDTFLSTTEPTPNRQNPTSPMHTAPYKSEEQKKAEATPSPWPEAAREGKPFKGPAPYKAEAPEKPDAKKEREAREKLDKAKSKFEDKKS